MPALILRQSVYRVWLGLSLLYTTGQHTHKSRPTSCREQIELEQMDKEHAVREKNRELREIKALTENQKAEVRH